MENNNPTSSKDETAVFGTKELNEPVRQYKNKMRGIYFRGFIALISFILSFVLLSSYETSYFGAILFFFLLSFVCILANIVTTIKMKRQSKKNAKDLRRLVETEQQKLKSQGMVSETVLRHISGLGTAANVFCTIQVWQEHYTFIMNNITFNLQRDKVTDIAIKTETEVQQQYVSSVGGAVLGGALFGAAGAAYGGRAKKKEIKTISSYLVFTYVSEASSDVKYLVFESTPAQALDIVATFHKTTNENVSIEL